MPRHDFRNIKTVLSRNGKVKGRVCGAATLCRLEGCGGLCIPVRWPDGKLTKPCTKGMAEVSATVLRIM